ncbi:adenylate/guanylate cyclase domain-containing protein [Modestobacter sp. VKM Ac-2983]|uniref:adenylate/guanylate cyclase domain-containing protein n=1 Tax=Modestobacter sp. VKM Ac-2983 TaxID=3004137 RepID=UPI0022AB9A24|nr:adenylate/guanylate cyclase domain-containing protein [Modestobacter sp. VKM Ac-2983]MCZ2806639.1 adenylate/guanylate cyclase domain-containing protein [Modestobacter sp. VKM Ac-2983]
MLLEGPRRYTRRQVAELAGMPPERTQRLWRALGFADVPEGDPAFTDADVTALARLSALIDSGFVEPGAEASIARAMGQSLSRLADWQTDMLATLLTPPEAAPADRAAVEAEAVRSTERLLPLMRELQDYVWRRHLAANAGRLFLAAPGGGDRRELAVGFADLVGYTSRSRGMGGRELGVMVEDFEGLAADVIARFRGRVVKTVGDGVLFTCADPVDAVEIALLLPEEWTAADRPPLRVGAAHGPVLTRLGDVYSPVVNLASRLTSIARPSTVLVDQQLARELRGVREYRVRPLRRVSVRGYDNLRPWLVRRSATGGEAPGVAAFEELLDEIADDVLAAPEEEELPGGAGPFAD